MWGFITLNLKIPSFEDFKIVGKYSGINFMIVYPLDLSVFLILLLNSIFYLPDRMNLGYCKAGKLSFVWWMKT